MSVAFYRWSETDEATKARIIKRAQADIESVSEAVRPIIENVQKRGDEALRECAKKFEKANVRDIRVCTQEFDVAEQLLDERIKGAITRCVRNVRRFHEEQMRRVETHWMIEVEPGVWAGEQVTPLDSVGLYVPRGKGAFPSALYMLAVPAVIAGVKQIAIVTPPTPEGGCDAATLFTARLCGVENVYKCGGAQAIAALAYGTESVPKVCKVLGPGSPYVAAAKSLLSHVIDPGMPAGPSESIILADESADPDNTILDILNEAEHGEDSAALLVTHDEKLALYVRDHIGRVIDSLPSPHREICHHVMAGYGGIILTDSQDDSVAFSNLYAPEHLHLKVKNGQELLPKLKNAGEILVGEYTPSSLGNYGIGVNHVLPTGGWARSYSCTSVWDFLKRTSISECDQDGFVSLRDDVAILTEYENFPAHGEVLKRRKL